MKCKFIVPIALAAVLAVPVSATAAPTQTFSAGAELLNQPKGQPWNLNLFVQATFGTNDGSALSPVTRMQMKFPSGAKYNGSSFATCTLSKVTKQTCPSASKIGSGTAKALLGTDPVDAKISVYNGPGTDKKRSVYMYSRALSTVTFVLEGTMTKTSGKFGYALDVKVPPIVPQLIPGGVPIVSFETTIGGSVKKKGKRIPLVSSPTSCKGGWSFAATFTYSNGASGSVNSAIPCRLAATPSS